MSNRNVADDEEGLDVFDTALGYGLPIAGAIGFGAIGRKIGRRFGRSGLQPSSGPEAFSRQMQSIAKRRAELRGVNSSAAKRERRELDKDEAWINDSKRNMGEWKTRDVTNGGRMGAIVGGSAGLLGGSAGGFVARKNRRK